MLVYRIVRAIIRYVLLPAQMRLKVYHAERCPRSGAVIIIGNHLGLIDPVIIASYVRRPIRILAKSEVFSWPFLGLLARLGHVVPVRRGESDRVAVRTLAQILAQGDCIQLMPEGTYPKVPLPPAMLRAKTGAAFLALHTHAQVLPVALTGTERIWSPSRGWRVWHRPRVTLTFGEPFQPVAPEGVPAKQAYQMVADEMSRHVAALLPEAYRGYYATTPALEQHAAPDAVAAPEPSDAGLPHAQSAGQNVGLEG